MEKDKSGALSPMSIEILTEFAVRYRIGDPFKRIV